MMKACANLSFLFKEAGELLSRYNAAAAAGFRYVECDFPTGLAPEDIKKALCQNNLSQILINCYHGSSGEMGFLSIPDQQTEFQESIERTIKYAQKMDCKKLHILSGLSKGQEKFELQLTTMESNLRWASKRLESEGIVGLIEPINPHSKPGYFLSSYDIAVRMLEKVNCCNIKLQLDLFHLQRICGNVSFNIERLMPYVGHIQIAQSPHRHEPSSFGELNMKYIIDLLKQHGYEGYIGCEYIPSGATLDTLQWIKNYGLSY